MADYRFLDYRLKTNNICPANNNPVKTTVNQQRGPKKPFSWQTLEKKKTATPKTYKKTEKTNDGDS